MADMESPQRTWGPDEKECWRLFDVKVMDSEKSVVHVCDKREGKMQTFNLSEVHSFDPSHLVDLDNISDMNNVHEGPLLDLLRRRYAKNVIYTFTGDILISMNPYKGIPGIYKLPQRGVVTSEDAKPHLFTVAARALEHLRENPAEEQTIIINGESGAGKTEASKHIIKLLSHLSSDSGETSPDDVALRNVQSQIIDTNLLLEEFGNAKTVRNDNSSRFGKYIRLEYQNAGLSRQNALLTGAHISYFLLETSRIVSRSSKERNYHVFYALCEGASDEERQVLGIQHAKAYRYLQPASKPTAGKTPDAGDDSDAYSIAGRDEQEVWCELKKSLRRVGLDDNDMLEISRGLATILELGNIEVKEREKHTNDSETVQNVVVAEVDRTQPALVHMTELLGLEVEAVCRALTGRIVVSNSARGSMQRVELSRSQAIESINALAKAIYSRLFDWLLVQINLLLAGEAAAATTTADLCSCIGILDIYGFEILEHNSFEQLCINFANERLQRQFNSKVFDAEQERYLVEGVAWAMEDFGVDNQPCIDLIGQTRLGILSILDEQTLMLYHAMGISSGTSIKRSARQVEEQLLQKLHTAHGGKHPNYIKPRIAGTTFKVRHFAGVVEYDVIEFPRKNTDTLHSDLIMLMSGSTRPFVRGLFQRDVDEFSREQEQRSAIAKKRIFQTNSTRQISELDRKLNRRRMVDGDAENHAPNQSSSRLLNDCAEEEEEVEEDQSATDEGSLGESSPTPPADNASGDLEQEGKNEDNDDDGDDDDDGSGSVRAPQHSSARYHHRTGSMVENIFSAEGLRANFASESGQGSAAQLTKASRVFAARNTVGFRFKQQLHGLMTILDAARPHYIRCIKPNARKMPDLFESDLVLEQLRYIGVLETVRIRKTGYPVRFRFPEFCARYDLLLRDNGLRDLSNDELSVDESGGISDGMREVIRRTLDTNLEPGQWQVGNTSVFLRDHQNDALDAALRRVQGERATRIQALMRQAMQRRRFESHLRKKGAATQLQAFARMCKASKAFKAKIAEKRRVEAIWQRLAEQLYKKHQEKRASAIQQWTRVCLDRKRNAAAAKMQSIARVFLAKRLAKRERIRQGTERAQEEAAVKLQALVRGVLSRAKVCGLKRWRKAAERLQVALRAFWRNRQLARRMQALHEAALAGKFEVLKSTCEQALDEDWEVCGVRWWKRNFCTLLHSAVVSGSVETVRFILEEEAGSAVHGIALSHSVDGAGNSALHEASRLKSEACFDLCNLLVDHVGANSMPPEEDEMRRAARGNNAEDDKVMRDLLLKRKVRKTFHRRVVMLDPSKGTLSYFKSKQQTTPRCALNLGKECGTTLRVSDRYRNCFEIHSPDLLSNQCKAGRVLFKCSTQKQLQEWLSAIRGVEGVGFMAALSALERIDRISWSQVLAYILQENGQQQTVLHLAAARSLELTLWLMAVVSYQGPLSLVTFLETPDAAGLTARAHAAQAGRKDICAAIDKLQDTLNRSSKLASAGRRSITPRTLLSSAKSGGTYLSLYIGRLSIPGPEGLEDPVLIISVVNDVSANKLLEEEEEKEGSGRSSPQPAQLKPEPSSASLHGAVKAAQSRAASTKESDLVEERIVLHPLHVKASTSEDGNTLTNTSLNFGAMWHMQTPLEQLSNSVTVVLQLCHGKSHNKVKSIVRLPFNARTIGVGTLSPGPQEMVPAEVDLTRNPGPFARAVALLGLNKKHVAAPLDPTKEYEVMNVKVHYSLRSQPCVNCFE
ncbi:Myosin-VIIa [Hondaea fermentalgiana]|uniref:Myosin-VIIa n=1 Tax=Hondaea fermentalgiana TaxID=2315210 RepID=A0A2R5GQ75_9STRA|nr:Myosin-VIIa [Hondaea fermentalgiana]|eukprot:GBG33017.1 Myosin-VIIa [Hondaea fermentalgiana]